MVAIPARIVVSHEGASMSSQLIAELGVDIFAVFVMLTVWVLSRVDDRLRQRRRARARRASTRARRGGGDHASGTAQSDCDAVQPHSDGSGHRPSA